MLALHSQGRRHFSHFLSLPVRRGAMRLTAMITAGNVLNLQKSIKRACAVVSKTFRAVFKKKWKG